MNFKIWWFLPVFVISAIFVAIVLPAIVRTANKMNLYDSHDKRNLRICNISRLGDVSFTPNTVLTYDGHICDKRCPVNHPVTMFRKSSVMRVGGYQHFPYLEDYYLWARMLVSGAVFYNIQESLLYFRSSDDVFKRRGGWKYAVTEMKFMWQLYRIGYVGLLSTLSNIVIRFCRTTEFDISLYMCCQRLCG